MFSAVYEPELDLLVAIDGFVVNGAGARSESKRLDCAGGWWLQAGATANGSVQVIPTKPCFAPNDVVRLVASPTGGAGFNQWLGDASGSANPLDVTMNGNKTIVAEILTRTTAVDDVPVASSSGDSSSR